MKIGFRVDSSIQIGTGHLMRCLTVANELRLRNIDVFFICRDLPGNLCDIIGDQGHKVFCLPYLASSVTIEDDHCQYSKWRGVSVEIDREETKMVLNKERADWLIVDSYSLDYQWEKEMRSCVSKIMVIDDLANRKHDCDIILDQNYYSNYLVRYDKLVPKQCCKLLGPSYALLRPEFLEGRKRLRTRNGMVKRIFIFLGGSDLTNETSKILKAIALLKEPNIIVDVVLGKNNSHFQSIESEFLALPWIKIHYHISNISELMMNADLCIGAAGGTTWERCCLGLPSMVIAVAENQIPATRDMADAGILHYIGDWTYVSIEIIYNELHNIILKQALLQQYEKTSLTLVDGFGAMRCVENIISIGNSN